MAIEFTTDFKNEIAAVESANLAITAFLESHAVPPKLVYALNLAVEEMATNIIKYGYDDAAEHQITLVLRLDQNNLTMTISDDGHAFNPLQRPAVDVSGPIEDRDVGGLGIHLVRNLFDELTYERRAGRNVFTVGKHLTPKT
jgi:serine/threonine-protein kinase RsbW